MSLITVAEVEAVHGQQKNRALVEHAINRLSMLFCQEAGQDFQLRTLTQVLKVNGGIVRLGVKPVQKVEAVNDVETGRAVDWVLKGGVLRVGALSHQLVEVTYRAGYDGAPEIVKSQLIDSVGRYLALPETARQGVSQVSETVGPHTRSQTFAAWAVGGQVMLSPDDIALSHKFRPIKTGNVWVVKP